MPTSGCATIASPGCRVRRMILLGLVLLALLDTVSGIPYKRSLQRLCSKSLSDALALACKERGYNEPFPNSDEEGPQYTVGPGLVEECCYHQCSYAQLQQYCKPDKASPADAVNKPVWIVDMPSNPARAGTSSEEEESSRMYIDYVTGTIKCRIHGSKGARKKRRSLDSDDAVDCDGRSSAKRHRGDHCGCRHRRQRRCRFRKVLENAVADGSSKKESSNEPVSESNVSPFS
ncbi:insulin-like peptide isoform X2 [Andrena cerasifolii]|uniref:insulin-like peptide isoform X2 n=1 Tax=Andrena cerasifolii TaxID=2819439 RepID=UPI004038153E